MSTPLKRKAVDLATTAAKKPKANASITSFFTAPKPSTDSNVATSSAASDAVGSGSQQTSSLPSTTAAPKFDKAKWIEKLTAEQKELLTLEIETLHESWLAQLKEEVLSKEFLELKRFLKREKEAGTKVFPPGEDVYSWYGGGELSNHWMVSTY